MSTDIPSNQQRLIHKGYEMLDDKRMIDYSVRHSESYDDYIRTKNTMNF